MSLLNALILGIIQGVAEFLPISSSGHLSIAQNLLGLGVEGTDDLLRRRGPVGHRRSALCL